MSLVTAVATLALVAFLLWRAVVVWRARHRPTPPPSASSSIGMVPGPPDLGGPDGGAAL